jgi:hypothetical protein
MNDDHHQPGMGIIASITPDEIKQKAITRIKGITADDIKKAGSIRIILAPSRSDESWNKMIYSVNMNENESSVEGIS